MRKNGNVFFVASWRNNSGQFSCVFFLLKPAKKAVCGIRYGPEGFSGVLRPDEKKGGFSWYSAESGPCGASHTFLHEKTLPCSWKIMEKETCLFHVCGNNALQALPSPRSTRSTIPTETPWVVIGPWFYFQPLSGNSAGSPVRKSHFRSLQTQKDMCLLAFSVTRKRPGRDGAGATGTAATEILEYLRDSNQTTG
jgi:hypothetical protein